MDKKKKEMTFKDVIGIFIPKLWIVAICAIVFSVVFGVYTSQTKNNTYTSYFQVHVKDNEAISGVRMSVEEAVEIYHEYIILKPVSSQIIEKLPEKYQNIGLTPDHIRSYMSVAFTNSTSIFRVSITTTDPDLSLAIATSAEDVILPLLNSVEIRGYVPESMQDPEEATMNGKGTLKSVFLGLVFGIVASLLAIFVIDVLDVVVRKKKDVEDHFDIPILGVIPHFDINKSNGGK